jgi:site-specific DNA-methyltransferase (adenine-specific)
MRGLAGGKQMKNVWRFTAPRGEEKKHGKHPTQKPVSLVERCIMASTHEGALVGDPFMGSGTTGVASLKHKRRFAGIELEKNFFDLAYKRIRHAEKEAVDLFSDSKV